MKLWCRVMKILIKNRRFHGGAAISILEYVKLLKDDYEIVVIGDRGKVLESYEKLGIQTAIMPKFAYKSLILNFILIMKLSKVILIEKPNVIIANTFENCIFCSVIQKILNINVINIVPGGYLSNFHLKLLNSLKHSPSPFIVFSEENRSQLQNAGIQDDKIHVITNRFNFLSKEDLKLKNGDSPQPIGKSINLLLISRLDREKINSVIHVINTFSYLYNQCKDIQLHIAGDGEFLEDVRNKADEINRSVGKNIIFVLGYVHNVQQYIINSHIVFGKGRSIIEAMYYKKIAIVVNENFEMSICRANNMNELYVYNFSGRNLKQADDASELLKIIKDIQSGKELNINVEEIKKFIIDKYDINKAKNKIMQIINNYSSDKMPVITFKGILKGILQYIKIYFIAIFAWLTSKD